MASGGVKKKYRFFFGSVEIHNFNFSDSNTIIAPVLLQIRFYMDETKPLD